MEEGTKTSSDVPVPPREELPRWYPYCCGKPILYGYPEALGWLLSNSAHSVYLIGGGAFIVPAILHLASIEAGCEDAQEEECSNKVYGMKPSSLITTVSTIISVVVALITPLLGALVDYTPHRRLIGRFLSILYCVLVLPQIFLSSQTWFAVLITFLILGVVMWSRTLIVHSYLPELTSKEEELNQLTKWFSVGPFLSIVIFILLVLMIATFLGWREDEVATARLCAAMNFGVLSILYWISWGYPLMEKRPALHALQPTQSLLTAGFRQIYQTSGMIYGNYKALGWFYVAVAFGDVKPITVIAVTFFTDQLQFSPTQTGVAAIIMLIASIPGALVSSWWTRKFNAIWTSIVSMIIMMVFSSLAAGILKGPEQQLQAFVMAAGWGIGGGFKHTATRMLASAIIPQGQEAELMGFYLFADQLLSWLPPLVYTALNEAGISQRVGLASLNVYFLIALGAYIMMGSYRDAILAAGRLVAGGESDEEDEKKLPPPPTLHQSCHDVTLDDDEAIESMTIEISKE